MIKSKNIQLLQKLKRVFRFIIAYVLYITGYLNYIAKKRLKNKAVILMYHRIVDKNEISKSYSQNGIIVSTQTFESQMKFLKKNFNIISLSTLIDKITNKSDIDSQSCFITFDDGWKDNFINAYPVLKTLEIPAVIFLATDFISSKKRFWQEQLTDLLMALYLRCKKDLDLRDMALDKFQAVNIKRIIFSKEGNLREQISNFISDQKKEKEGFVKEFIHKLKELLGNLYNDYNQLDEFLDWNEIKVMSNNRIDFGSHGMSHGILTRNKNTAYKEISESKTVIEQELHTKINSFSYPNGDYNDEIIRLVRNSCYNIAFGTESGFVSPQDNPYKIKRINIHEDMTESIPMFLSRILGIW